MYWRDKDCGADSGIIELLAGNRHCSEKLLSGMLLDPTGERELSQEKRYDQRAGRMINEVLWLIDQLGNVTYVSAAIELISGKNSVSYIGKNIFHAVSPGNMQITQEIYRTGIKHSRKDTVGPVISRGTFIVGKNRKISLIISFLPMKIDRELVGFVGSFMCEENSGMKTRRESRLPEELNERERRILEYLVEGCSNKEIGNRMALAEITVKKSLTRIYEIFKVVNRSGLMAEMYKIK
jgi:DNA-binding CsgD family transcriptional regulator